MHVLSGKQVIAWFALAEFVQRKEKERALAVYRLLAHSLAHDVAVAAQLEGDLLQAFNDVRAADAYMRAFEVFEKEGRSVHAASIGAVLTMYKDVTSTLEKMDCNKEVVL